MPEDFDPYRKWLGIPPKDRPPRDRPPNHYRLLSLELFEDDADAISNAADRQMAHVRTFQTGEHSALSQKLLNELSAARICLLNREKKVEYDTVLRQVFAAQGVVAAPKAVPRAAPLPAAQPLPAPQAVAQPMVRAAAVIPVDPHPLASATSFVTRTSSRAPRRRGGGWQIPAAVVATLALLAGAVYVAMNLDSVTRVENSPPSPASGIADRPKADDAKEHRRPHDDPPKKTTKTTPGKSSGESRNKIPGSATTSSNEQPPRGGNNGPIDLLKLIDPKRDAVAGQWRMADGRLHTPTDRGARILVPCDVPDEYTWTIVVECASHPDSLNLGLVVGGVQILFVIDGWKGGISGISLLDNLDANANETTREGRFLLDNLPNTIVCTVRKSGLRVTCNGLSLVDWSGDIGRLGLPRGWEVPNSKQLFICSNETSFQISRLELAPLAREASTPAIATTQSPPLLPGQIDLLGRIDVDRDKVTGTWKRDTEGLVSPAGGLARLKIPYAVPDEYVVTVEVERISGEEAFGVGLASGKWWTVAWLGGRTLYPTGLHRIQNSAKDAQAGRLPRGKRTTLAYCVRKTGLVLLRPSGGAIVSWRGIIDWKGDFGTWTWPESWDAPEKGHMELISSESGFRVLRCLLTPVNDWKPDDENVARVAKGLAPLGGGDAPTVNPRAPLGKLLTTPEKRVPVPSADRLTEARRVAKDKFQQDLQAAKTPEQHLIIARKSQRAALDEKADSPERYALLDLARELAAGMGSSKVAFEAIDGLAKWFEVEELEMRLATLEVAAKAHSGPTSKAAKKEQFDSAKDLIETCVASDRFPEALRAAVVAQAAARNLREQDPGLAKQIAEERKELDRLAKAFAAIKDDLERLKADAGDPAANLEVGRFYCLAKKDWERGLPHLAAGNDATLKELAQRELAKPSGADGEKSLGDAWWELSRKEKGPIKAVFARRGCFWYRRAVTFLSGVEKEAVEQKLEEVGETGQTDKTQFLSELPETNVVVENKWFAKGRNAVANKALQVGGKESPHGLFTHPTTNGTASVTYELNKKAKRLNLDVGIDDGANANPRTALLFQVWGDGVLLQTLGPVAVKGQVLGCELNVENVKVLELRVICSGRNNSAHAVWLEPRVTWK